MPELITPADRIYVAGHRGMAGSAICRALQRAGYPQLLTATRQELDLRDGSAVERWFAEHQPTVVVLTHRPDWVLNAGAYTAVDQAESESWPWR